MRTGMTSVNVFDHYIFYRYHKQVNQVCFPGKMSALSATSLLQTLKSGRVEEFTEEISEHFDRNPGEMIDLGLPPKNYFTMLIHIVVAGDIQSAWKVAQVVANIAYKENIATNVVSFTTAVMKACKVIGNNQFESSPELLSELFSKNIFFLMKRLHSQNEMNALKIVAETFIEFMEEVKCKHRGAANKDIEKVSSSLRLVFPALIKASGVEKAATADLVLRFLEFLCQSEEAGSVVVGAELLGSLQRGLQGALQHSWQEEQVERACSLLTLALQHLQRGACRMERVQAEHCWAGLGSISYRLATILLDQSQLGRAEEALQCCVAASYQLLQLAPDTYNTKVCSRVGVLADLAAQQGNHLAGLGWLARAATVTAAMDTPDRQEVDHSQMCLAAGDTRGSQSSRGGRGGESGEVGVGRGQHGGLRPGRALGAGAAGQGGVLLVLTRPQPA